MDIFWITIGCQPWPSESGPAAASFKFDSDSDHVQAHYGVRAPTMGLDDGPGH